MAAGTAYSSLFQADTSQEQGFSPISGRPDRRQGSWDEQVTFTLATTSVDDVGDRYAIASALGGSHLLSAWRLSADHDTGGPTLDMDLTAWYYDADGAVAGEITLYDASANTVFSGAVTSPELIIFGTNGAGLQLPNPGGICVIGYKVLAAATTPASGVDKWIFHGGAGR
jgi:hypothetical protein